MFRDFFFRGKGEHFDVEEVKKLGVLFFLFFVFRRKIKFQ